MTDDNVIKLMQPGSFEDPLTEVLRNGARALLAQAVEAEVAAFLGRHADLKTEDGRGRDRASRPSARARDHDRHWPGGGSPASGSRSGRGRRAMPSASASARPSCRRYARRTKSLDVLIPILYLKGLSTGDFQEALAALLGKDAPGLSASTISRLKEIVERRARSLAQARSVGPALRLRLGRWHLPAGPARRREAVHSRADRRDAGRQEGADRLHRWRARERAGLARAAARSEGRGLVAPPKLAIADGALGFWKALGELWPTTAEQRCWVHKTANVLNKLPKSQQPKAKRALQDIWMAATRKDADERLRCLLGRLRAEIREGRRLPGQGSPGAARLLRLPCRALEAPAHLEPDREHVRHRAPPHHPRQGLSLEERRRWPWSSSSSRPHRKAGDGSTGTTSCRSSCSVPGSPTGSRSQPTILSPKPPPEPRRRHQDFGHSSIRGERIC